MNRGDIGLVLGLAGFILGGVAVFMAASMRQDVLDLKNERLSDNDNLAGLGGRLEDLDRAHKDLGQRVSRMSSDPNKVWESVHVLEARMEKLEQAGGQGSAPSSSNGGVSQKPDAAKAGMSPEEFEEIRDKVFEGEATDDEEEAFWAAVRTKPELVTGIITDLEKKVAETPRDIDMRLNLATAYITKLYAGGMGPEAGLWAGKAEKQWKAVLDIDPDHWDAHYSLGTSYSYYPDQFNKRPDAIRHFEAARKVQEGSTPKPQHAQTYVQLRQLYLKEGKTDEAKAIVEEGLRRFPEDANLKKLRDGAK